MKIRGVVICWDPLSSWRRCSVGEVDWAARKTLDERGGRWEAERREYTAEVGFIFSISTCRSKLSIEVLCLIG